MVGLVFVSHSRALAEALLQLVRQVAINETPIAIAAGVGDGRQEFGTDAVEVSEAILSVYSDDGVLVLMDLGSAVLSAEMALELLPPEMGQNVRFSGAPLVEGAIGAAVQAGLGSDLETVQREAETALQPKAEHLGESAPGEAQVVSDPAALPGSKDDVQTIVVTLKNLHGLHARPAAQFVQTAGSFQAEIRVLNTTTGKGPVSAKSLNGLATLGAVGGHQVQISASGPEAGPALQTLQKLVDSGFGELEKEAVQAVSTQPELAGAAKAITSQGDHPESDQVNGGLKVVPVSDGVATGPLFRYQAAPPPIPIDPSSDPDLDWLRLQKAIEATQANIRQRRQKLKASLGEEQSAIFDAHLLILQDPDLVETVQARICNQRENPAAAWQAEIMRIAESYEALSDPYLSQRGADVRDVGNQVLFALAGKGAGEPVQLPHPVILYADEITPTETSQLDMTQVLGLVTVTGGPTSHSAILARALGIPAVTGVEGMLNDVPTGALVAVDGFSGKMWINPNQDTQDQLAAQRKAWLEQRQHLLQESHSLAVTKDGRRVEVAANIGNVIDAQAAVQNGAEGVGLLRTEFLYLTRTTPPTEEEQFALLKEIGEVLGDRPVVVRTLDVGGDKDLPYIDLPEEPNPFLGVRAIRLSLQRPDLFLPQLRSILRAAAYSPLRIMFPMVANLEEALAAKRFLAEAHEALVKENVLHQWPIETGIMVEIPSAAIQSHQFAPHVDFFSIGTNDLTQYTLAAERGNPALSGLADAMHPAILRLIAGVCEAAHAHGKWVGVCGELAGDALAVPVLVGLGVDELSMSPAGIPRAKAVVRALDAAQARHLAPQVLEAQSANEVRQLARQLFAEAYQAAA